MVYKTGIPVKTPKPFIKAISVFINNIEGVRDYDDLEIFQDIEDGLSTDSIVISQGGLHNYNRFLEVIDEGFDIIRI